MSKRVSEEDVCPVCEAEVIVGQVYCSASCERLDLEIAECDQMVEFVYNWLEKR